MFTVLGMLKTNFRVGEIKIFNMKKLFTILTVVALTTTISFAQVQFGIKAGFNSSAIGSSDADFNEVMSSKMGMKFGFATTIPFGDVV